MFCNHCGRELTNEGMFCKHCGAKIEMIPNEQDRPKIASKRKTMKIWLMVIACLAAALVIFAVYNNMTKRATFDFNYCPEDIEKFLETVCKNIECKSAKITDVDRYYGEVTIKLEDGSEDALVMGFYPEDKIYKPGRWQSAESRPVSDGYVYFDDSSLEEEYKCQKAFLVGLEKTVSGNSYVEEYLPSLDEMEEMALALDDTFEPKIIAKYSLTDNLTVTIDCERTIMREWSVQYNISRSYSLFAY